MSAYDDARREAEHQFLGALLLEPARLGEVREIVRPQDLADPRHAALLRELERRLEAGEPVDRMVLAAALSGPPARIQAPHSLIVDLEGAVTSTAHLLHHARQVAGYGRLARVRRTGLELADEADRTPPHGADELLARAEHALASLRPPARPRWTPYPVEVLPESIYALALEGAAAIGCDPTYIALPALVVCAGAIGLSRDVRIKRKWREPSVLWGAVIAESGSAKSPGLDVAADPLRELEAAARRAHERDLVDWRERCDVMKAQAKGKKPELPDPPALRRHVVQDTTIEALARTLAANPRGVAVVRDELGGWVRSWDEYKGGKSGSDSAKWLELHGARALTVDRVLAGGSLYVPRAAVSVIGGIQPGILRRVLGGEHVESGCAARILYAMPPRGARRWTDAEIGEATGKRFAAVVRALATLDPGTVHHDDGETSLAPEDLTLAREAQALFEAWVNELGADAVAYQGAEAAAAAKLEGGAARIALVVALVVAAEKGRAADLTKIDGEAMRAGVEIARWHWREARRVYRALGIATGPAPAAETPDARERRELLELARERGGGLTVRDLRDARSRYRPEGAAEAALRALAEVGHGQVTVGPRGGIRWTAGTGPAGPGPVTDPCGAESAGCGTGTVVPGPGAPGAVHGSDGAKELVL